MNKAWLERELESGRASLKHEVKTEAYTTTVNGKTERHTTKEILLTASTEDLQAFLLDRIDDPTAFGGASKLRRARKIEVAPAGLASKRQRTLEYWCEVRALSVEPHLPPGAKPDQIAQELTRMAKEIEDLPTLGVDLIASDCALETASAFNRMSDYAKTSQSGERMFEAAIRGFFGDPLGVANEMAAEHKALGDQLKLSIEKCKKGRVLLTDLYAVEFPGVK